jgi:hypothetical protein
MKSCLARCAILVLLPASAFPQHHNWMVIFLDGTKFSDATLVSMQEDSLRFSSGGETRTVPVSDLGKIERRVSPPKTWLGAFVGAAVGAGLGYAVNEIFGLGGTSTDPSSGEESHAGTGVCVGGGAVLGTLVGAGIGGASGMESYSFRNSTHEENLASCRSLVGSEGASGNSPDGSATPDGGDAFSPSLPPTLVMSVGTGFPMNPSEFADYWGAGWSGEIEIETRPSSQVSLTFSAAYNDYRLDEEKFKSGESASGVTITELEGGTVSTLTILAGPSVRFVGDGKPFIPFLSLGAGYFSLSASDLYAAYTSAGRAGTFNFNFDNQGAFDVQARAGCDYHLSPGIALDAQLAYNIGFTNGPSTQALPLRVGVRITL